MSGPQGRQLAQRYVQDIADYLQSEGIDVAPQRTHDESDNFKVNNLVGIDNMVLRTNRAFRIKLSESLDDAEAEAKATGKDLACVIQFRMDQPAAKQYVILSLKTLTRLLGAV